MNFTTLGGAPLGGFPAVDSGIAAVNSTKATDGPVSSLDVALPAGSEEGNFALIVSTLADTASITLPAGFTTIHNGIIPNSAIGDKRIHIGYKILTASEPSTYTVTFGIGTEAATVSCNVWSTVDISNPIDVPFQFTTIDNSLNPLPDCPTVTTVTDGAIIVNIVSDSRGPAFGDMDFENYYQPPASVSEVIDANWNAGTGYSGHAVGWETIDTAGATGTRTWACIDNNDGGFAGTLALRPAQPIPPVTGDLTTSTGDTTAAATGDHGVAGDLTATTGDTTATITGDHPVTGDLAATTDDTVAAVTGTHGVAGDLTTATDDTTAAVTGTHGVAGDLAATTEDTTAAIVGDHAVAGDLAATTDDTSATISASFGDDVAGSLSATLADTTAALTASHGVVGDLAATTEDTVATIAATHENAVDGDLAATTEDTVASLAASHGVVGDVTTVTEDTTATVSGTHYIAGDLSSNLDDTTAAISADHLIAGDLAATTGDTVAALEGTFTPAGDGSLIAVLDNTTAAATGDHGVVGTSVASVGDLSLEIVASHGVVATASPTMGDVTAEFSGEYEDSTRTMTMNAVLDDTAAAISGSYNAVVAGDMVVVLGATAAASSGTHGVTAQILATLEGTSAIFTFKPASIGVAEHPDVLDVSPAYAAVDASKQAGITDASQVPGAHLLP